MTTVNILMYFSLWRYVCMYDFIFLVSTKLFKLVSCFFT